MRATAGEDHSWRGPQLERATAREEHSWWGPQLERTTAGENHTGGREQVVLELHVKLVPAILW